MVYKFYDTSSILLLGEHLFDDPKVKVVISSITLKELEEIKTSIKKTEHVKYLARQVINQLNKHPDEYIVWIYKKAMLNHLRGEFDENNDAKILASAINCELTIAPDNLIFVTNDLSLKNIANLFFGSDSIESVVPVEDSYCGYKEVTLSEEEMSDFYQNLDFNAYDLMINEYIILKEAATGNVVDSLYWDGERHKNIRYADFRSAHFGQVKPFKDDVYQALAVDSLTRNKITMLKGPAGSGKTYLSLSFLLNRLEQGKINKIIVFCNTVATVNSAKLGFYPGSRDEKLLDSQIGNLLASKFGGRIEVERMINDEQLVLLPLSDIRGFDTTGMQACIYISEAQNLDITLMKLALQRIGEDSICIIDGDDKTQVDCESFANENNGMKRASKIFRGSNLYGEIELKNIHRSRIAKLAEEM